jgi:hypothetical protein
MEPTNDGGYIVAGYTYSFGAGWADIWILKLSSEGDIEWQRTYGGFGNENAYGIQQINDGGYIVASVGGGDFWILKLSSEGDIEWQKKYGGIDGDSPKSLLQTNDGGFIVAGVTSSFVAGRELFDCYGWILKLLSNGDIEWQKIFIGSESIAINAIKKTVDGGYIFVGRFGNYSLTEHNSYMLVIKLFPDCNIEWQRIYGGSRPDVAFSVYQTNDGGYIVSGWIGGRPSPGENTDISILKLSPNGDVPFCGIIGSSDASVSDTSISPLDTSRTPMNTNVIPQNTNILPQDTNAIVHNLCPGPHTLILSATTGGTTNPEPGTYTYDGGAEVTIRATPNSRYEFSSWSGDASGTYSPIQIVMDLDKSITANFTKESGGDGGDGGNGGGCLIATACYGTPMAEEVKTLSAFRDRYLITNPIGKTLIKFYYNHSPKVADFIRDKEHLKIIVRACLKPIIWLIS